MVYSLKLLLELKSDYSIDWQSGENYIWEQ